MHIFGIYDRMIRPGRTLLALLFLLAAATPCGAVVGRLSDWDRRFALPIADDAVLSAIEYRGELYVGGRFQVIGGVPARHIAHWDGTVWREVGGGLPGEVSALAVYQDQLVAAGGRSGGNEFGVMRWDGAHWTPLGDSPPAFVGVLLASDAGLIAGGWFQRGDALNVARWDGMHWSAMGAGFDNGVSALAEFQGSVYASGTFSSSGTTRVASVARWNGASWDPVGGGMSDPVYRLTVYRDELVAGGMFTRAGTVDARYLARWNGTLWDSLPSPVPPRAAGVSALASWNDTLYASVGGVPLTRWAGDAWQTIEGTGYPKGLVGTSLGLIALGATRTEVSTGKLLGRDVLAYDGVWHTFAPWTSGMQGIIHSTDAGDPYDRYPTYGLLVRDLAVYRDQLWLIPDRDASAGQPPEWTHIGSIARWDGDAWHDESPSGIRNFTRILAADDMLIAAATRPDPHYDSQMQTYDGTQWTTLPALPGLVTALARWRGSWYAATRYVPLEGSQLRRWDVPSRTWQQVGSFGTGYSLVTQMTAADDVLVCAGDFETVDGIQAYGMAGFDGDHWFALQGGAEQKGTVGDLTFFEGRLWCNGWWETPGARSSLAVWEHGAWNVVPTPKYVAEMAVHKGHLFAGTLDFDGGKIMMWDGAAWQEIVGSPEWPGPMASASNGLYVAGPFTSAGGNPDFGLAFWRGEPVSPTSGQVNHLGQPWPNPANASANVTFRLPQSGRVRVTVHDIRGALVAELADADYSAGSHFIPWNLLDRNGRPVRSGVYIVRLLGPGGIDEARRVVRM
jgi:hypothetical protein